MPEVYGTYKWRSEPNVSVLTSELFGCLGGNVESPWGSLIVVYNASSEGVAISVDSGAVPSNVIVNGYVPGKGWGYTENGVFTQYDAFRVCKLDESNFFPEDTYDWTFAQGNVTKITAKKWFKPTLVIPPGWADLGLPDGYYYDMLVEGVIRHGDCVTNAPILTVQLPSADLSYIGSDYAPVVVYRNGVWLVNEPVSFEYSIDWEPEEAIQQFMDANLTDTLPAVNITISFFSPSGDTTRLTKTLPQVTQYQASQSGGVQYFTFNSADGGHTNASYEIPTVTGKKLVGYSTQPNALIPEFPVETDGKLDVNWDSDTVLYEVYDRASPVPDTTFSINLYKNTGERKRVDKTDYLVTVGTISGALRAACDVQSPDILLEYSKFPDFNYVYIPAFGGRYYFVEKVVSAGKNLWQVSFTEDVLMSFKTGIKKLNAVIERQENDYNTLLADAAIPTAIGTVTDIIEFPVSFGLNSALTRPIVLSVFAGG